MKYFFFILFSVSAAAQPALPKSVISTNHIVVTNGIHLNCLSQYPWKKTKGLTANFHPCTNWTVASYQQSSDMSNWNTIFTFNYPTNEMRVEIHFPATNDHMFYRWSIK